MPSVTKRCPNPDLVHVDAHLSTIAEADVDMTEEAADSGIATDAAAAALASNEGEQNNAAGLPQSRLPLPEDVRCAETFQVSINWYL